MLANQVIYDSAVNIENVQDLATLSIFYDKIWLPHVATANIDLMQFEKRKGRWELRAFAVMMSEFIDHDGIPRSVDRYTNEWNERNAILFDEGVLERLKAPDEDPMARLFDVGTTTFSQALSQIHGLIDDIPMALISKTEKGGECRYIWQDHALHLIRNDHVYPEVFLLKDRADQRELVKSVLAGTLLSYCIPKLAALPPEEILELRRLTASNREGFMAHVQGLSAGLDALAKSGAKREDMAAMAADVVETKLIPDYVEFKRQLNSIRVGKLKKILDPASKILEINSSPWSPKFWYDLTKALWGIGTGATEVRQADRSNRTLAFNYIRTVEERSARNVPGS